MMTANERNRLSIICKNSYDDGYRNGKAEAKPAFVHGVVVGAVVTLFLIAVIHTVTL